jgi:hypothetical protein
MKGLVVAQLRGGAPPERLSAREVAIEKGLLERWRALLDASDCGVLELGAAYAERCSAELVSVLPWEGDPVGTPQRHFGRPWAFDLRWRPDGSAHVRVALGLGRHPLCKRFLTVHVRPDPRTGGLGTGAACVFPELWLPATQDQDWPKELLLNVSAEAGRFASRWQQVRRERLSFRKQRRSSWA